jgi:hypothetical protein
MLGVLRLLAMNKSCTGPREFLSRSEKRTCVNTNSNRIFCSSAEIAAFEKKLADSRAKQAGNAFRFAKRWVLSRNFSRDSSTEPTKAMR